MSNNADKVLKDVGYKDFKEDKLSSFKENFEIKLRNVYIE